MNENKAETVHVNDRTREMTHKILTFTLNFQILSFFFLSFFFVQNGLECEI